MRKGYRPLEQLEPYGKVTSPREVRRARPAHKHATRRIINNLRRWLVEANAVPSAVATATKSGCYGDHGAMDDGTDCRQLYLFVGCSLAATFDTRLDCSLCGISKEGNDENRTIEFFCWSRGRLLLPLPQLPLPLLSPLVKFLPLSRCIEFSKLTFGLLFDEG